MQLIWNKTFLPDEDYIRSPLYETSLHHYNDNGLSINVDIHMTIAIDKKDNCYLLFIWDTTPGIRNNDKTTLIPDIPLYRYDLSSILVFAHDFLDKFIIDRYGYILNKENTHAKNVTKEDIKKFIDSIDRNSIYGLQDDPLRTQKLRINYTPNKED